MATDRSVWIRLLLGMMLLVALLALQACGSGALCDDYCTKMDECGIGLGDDCVEACELRVAAEGEDYFECVVDKPCAEIPSCN